MDHPQIQQKIQKTQKSQKSLSAHPNATRYTDFRKMFEEMEGKIDAVSVGTPDFSHFPNPATAPTPSQIRYFQALGHLPQLQYQGTQNTVRRLTL